MGNINSSIDDQSTGGNDSGGEREVQGNVNGSERKVAAIGAGCGTERNTDSRLHLEGIEKDYDSPAGTRASQGTIP